MTRNKDFKRLVRDRMAKTGERYAAARAQLLFTPVVKKPAPASKPDYAALAGMSDAAVKAKTGCTWDRWVKSLDNRGAENMSHAEIAKVAGVTYKAGPWWGQMIAVGYERIKGMRARGQQRSGTYNATKSRTFNVSAGALFDAWSDAKMRKRWMPGEATRVRTATRAKSMRLEWLGGGIVAVTFAAKGAKKSSVAIEVTMLPTAAAAAQVKSEWADRFDTLAALLAEES